MLLLYYSSSTFDLSDLITGQGRPLLKRMFFHLMLIPAFATSVFHPSLLYFYLPTLIFLLLLTHPSLLFLLIVSLHHATPSFSSSIPFYSSTSFSTSLLLFVPHLLLPPHLFLTFHFTTCSSSPLHYLLPNSSSFFLSLPPPPFLLLFHLPSFVLSHLFSLHLPSPCILSLSTSFSFPQPGYLRSFSSPGLEDQPGFDLHHLCGLWSVGGFLCSHLAHLHSF